jgi:hypothetical protein
MVTTGPASVGDLVAEPLSSVARWQTLKKPLRETANGSDPMRE